MSASPFRVESALAAALLLLAGCGARGQVWTAPLDVVGPVVSAGELVWVNRTAQVAEVLDPSGARAALGLDLSPSPRGVAATPSGFVVTGGTGAAPRLDVVSLPDGAERALAVAHVYDRVAVSPDGHFAVLWFDPSAPPAPGEPAARNNNEITVVDLRAMRATAVQLGTESVAPERVVFSPDPGVAAVILEGTVVFVDLSAPERRVQVPLKLSDGTLLRPEQEIFSPDGRYLYVRTDGSDDVLALDVVKTAQGLQSAVNFLFFPGAAGLQDIAVPAGAVFTRSVAALYADGSGGSTAALLDATGDTSLTHAASFAAPGAHLQDLGQGMLLVWSGSRAVAGWEPLRDRVDADQLPAATVGAPLIGSGRAFFVHGAVGSGGDLSTALTRVALSDDGSRLVLRQSPLVLGGVPSASAVDPAWGAVLLAIDVARAGSGAATAPDDAADRTGSVVTLRPDTLAIGGLVLDDTVTEMGVVGGFGFAVHPSPLGDVTFFSLRDPSRASAHRVTGFLAGHLLDRGETP